MGSWRCQANIRSWRLHSENGSRSLEKVPKATPATIYRCRSFDEIPSIATLSDQTSPYAAPTVTKPIRSYPTYLAALLYEPVCTRPIPPRLPCDFSAAVDHRNAGLGRHQHYDSHVHCVVRCARMNTTVKMTLYMLCKTSSQECANSKFKEDPKLFYPRLFMPLMITSRRYLQMRPSPFVRWLNRPKEKPVKR